MWYDCFDFQHHRSPKEVSETEESEEEAGSPIFREKWTKVTLLLEPGHSCSYDTMKDTKVEYTSNDITAKYYSYEGNSLPWIGLCRLTDKVAHIISSHVGLLQTGFLGGLLSGSCGFYVVITNSNKQVTREVTLYRSTNEFSGAASRASLVAAVVTLAV
mmetsp:Transcript_31590/g.48293  ORF Transcript_31590/g.48293 Transcript_31590/m.48293 type:complete len:159 (+) Transcript_31590:173-649(+)